MKEINQRMFGRRRSRPAGDPSPLGAWVWKNLFWLILVIIALPIIIRTVKYVGSLWIADMRYQTVGTPAPGWGIGVQQPVIVRVDPLASDSITWSSGAVHRLREPLTYEKVNENGACFLGMISPGGWTEFDLTLRQTPPGPRKAVVVDFGTTKRFLEESEIVGINSIPGVHTEAVHLKELSKKDNQQRRITNEGSGALAECYLQFANGPQEVKVQVMRTTDRMTQLQYEVEVGLQEISFTLPRGNWRHAWVAPVRTKEYQAAINGIPIPSTGDGETNFLAVEVRIDDHKRLLDEPVVLQPAGNPTPTVNLKLRARSMDTNAKLKPAKVIVGVWGTL